MTELRRKMTTGLTERKLAWSGMNVAVSGLRFF